jgi:hypothetical protein
MKFIIAISFAFLLVACSLTQARDQAMPLSITPSLASYLSNGDNFEFEIRYRNNKPVIIAQTSVLSPDDVLKIKNEKNITVLFLNAGYQYFKFIGKNNDAILNVSKWGFITQLKLERTITGRNL